jgi:hypothetical protein
MLTATTRYDHARAQCLDRWTCRPNFVGPIAWTGNLLESLARYRLVINELTGLDESLARVERLSQRVLRVVAQRRLTVSVRIAGGSHPAVRQAPR